MQHSFALEVYQASTHPHVRTLSRLLWPNPTDREDGLSDMLVKALSASQRFDGKHMGAWLKTILRNVKRDQSAKGYSKMGTKVDREARRAEGSRLVYVDPHEGYADHLADLCDPEAVMIALEGYRSV